MPAASELARAWGGLMPKPSTACPAATEDAFRAVAGRVARGRWGRDRWSHFRSLARSRTYGTEFKSISLIASARQRYVQGGVRCDQPRSLAMGVWGWG